METGFFTLIPLEEQKNLRKSSYKSKRKLDKYKKMSTLLVKATASERFFSLTLFLFSKGIVKLDALYINIL